MTAYASWMTTELPREGAESESAWSSMLGSATTSWAGALAAVPSTSVAGEVPAAPEADALDVPLVGSTAVPSPSASVAYRPDCATLEVEHDVDGVGTVQDLDATTGCLLLDVHPVFLGTFGYRVEFGAALRTEAGDAVLLSGPSASLQELSSDVHAFHLAVPVLTGSGGSAGAGAVAVALDAAPIATTESASASANAESVTLRLNTTSPQAWATWWEQALEDSGVDAADWSVACDPVGCGPGATGRGEVTVVVEGPGSTDDDVAFSLAYGKYDLSLG